MSLFIYIYNGCYMCEASVLVPSPSPTLGLATASRAGS